MLHSTENSRPRLLRAAWRPFHRTRASKGPQSLLVQPEEHPDEKTCVPPSTSSGAAGPEVIAGDEIPSGAPNVYYPSAHNYDLIESQARVALVAELM